MPRRRIIFFLALLLFCSSVLSETTNATQPETTEKSPEPSEKDALLTRLKILEDQIAINNKKIQVLGQMRTISSTRNQTDSPLNLENLRETLSGYQAPQQTKPGQPKTGPGTPSKPVYEAPRGRTDPQNLMNKIMKKFTFELSQQIKDMSFISIKPVQKSQDEPPVTSLIVFLTTNNNILLYELNGNLLLAFEPNHKVKGFAVNQLTDENFIATLGTDNTIRMHSLSISRINIDEDLQDVKPKKGEKAKFVLSAIQKLEYIYDLENNQIISEGICEKICAERTEQNYGAFSAVQSRQLKQFALRAENGSLLLINRNGTFRGTYDFPEENFLVMQKFMPSPLFATDKSVGLFNLAALDIAKPNCDAPGVPILKVEGEQYSSNYFYALSTTGEVLIYESKPDSPCRMITRRSVAGFGQTAQPTSLHSSRNFLLVQKDARGIELIAYNITDVLLSGATQFEQYEISLYPAKTDVEKVAKAKYITLRSGYASNVIGAYFEYQNGTSIFAIHELTIHNKSSAEWLDDLRIPIIVGAILIVVGYQFFSKKKGHIHGPRGDHRGHNHGPGEECNDFGSRPVKKDPPGVTRRRVAEEPGQKFNAAEFDDLRRQYEGLKKAAATQQKEGMKKKVHFEDEDRGEDRDQGNGSDEDDYAQEDYRLYKKQR